MHPEHAAHLQLLVIVASSSLLKNKYCLYYLYFGYYLAISL